MRALVTSAGSTNGINIIKALQGHYVVAVDCIEKAGLYLADKHYIVPKSDNQNYLPTIKDIFLNERIDIVFPSHSNDIKLFIGSYFKTVLPALESYRISENKIFTKAFISNLGFNVPKQYPKEFPVIVKPIVGSGSKNTYKANTIEEVKGDNIFYEEFIDGIEYTVDGVSDFDGKVICCLPRIRLEKNGGMATKCVTEKNDELERMVIKIAESMKLVGVWNIQCIKKNGKYYFIDVNNRFPAGGMPLATASGMNIPVMLYDILKRRKPNFNLVYGKTMLRYWDSIII